MNLVFCCDRKVLAGLHVATMSVLEHLDASASLPIFWVFSDEIHEADIELLKASLNATGRTFEVHLRRVDPAPLANFPKLTGSLAAYYRLLVPAEIDAGRYLYLDVDILCKVDVSTALDHDLGGHPIALCSEGPMVTTADQRVFRQLGTRAAGCYFNTGVMLVDRDQWVEQNVTACCLEFLSTHEADFWDQSAVNFVLHGDISTLDSRYNGYTNARSNWPDMKSPHSGKGKLLHFVDYPKPWSRYGRWVHPLGREWWRAYRKTAHYGVGPRPDLEMPLSSRQWPGYKKILKDRLLFSAYSHGMMRPKGVPDS